MSHVFERFLLYQVKARIRILYRKGAGETEYGFFLSGYVEGNGIKRGSSLALLVTRSQTTEDTIKNTGLDLLLFFFFDFC